MPPSRQRASPGSLASLPSSQPGDWQRHLPARKRSDAFPIHCARLPMISRTRAAKGAPGAFETGDVVSRRSMGGHPRFPLATFMGRLGGSRVATGAKILPAMLDAKSRKTASVEQCASLCPRASGSRTVASRRDVGWIICSPRARLTQLSFVAVGHQALGSRLLVSRRTDVCAAGMRGSRAGSRSCGTRAS